MIGQKLSGRYEIAGELGRGGMGVVYRAHDPLLHRDVAVKLVPPGSVTPAHEERFQREAHVVAQMDHPSIVPIYDLGRHEDSLFFVMPVVPGVNLRKMIRDGGLVLGDVLEIGAQVADALDYSHDRGVVHRDIKPENVMVAREKEHLRVRVMDFGLAFAAAEDRLTKTGTMVGTVSYFSPEQVTSRSLDGRSDIYALGTLLYECLVGEPPFTGETQAVLYRIVHQLPQPLRAMGADVREDLDGLVLWCLEKDPARRPQRPGQVAEALRGHRAKLHEDEYSRSVVISGSRALPRPAMAAPFIGREKEFAQLQQRLNAAMAGECQFALVAGEPGIGKTRLLAELSTLAKACKARVLQGRFVEHGAFSHQGFCELIQDYFRSRDASSSASERPDLSDLARDLVALFPVLSEIGELRAAGEVSPSPAPRAVSEARVGETPKAEDKIAIFELLARTLARLAQGKPLLLVLEDLHGADVSIEALEYVVRRLAPTPTLVAGSYRQTEIDKRHPLVRMKEAFEDDPRFLSLTLGPFSASEHRALVESVVGGSKLSDALARRLYDSTEGNPFFTKELVRSLIDSGGLARDPSGAWGFSEERALAADALPATIQQAIEKRVRRLPEELRDLLSVASVFGKSFAYRDLESLVEGGRDLDEMVDRLLREGILEEEGGARGDRLTFASGIVRDVLYAALPRRKRRSIHRKYAELLESRHAGRLERVYPELVHHFSQGDVPEKTVEYGMKLSERLLQAFNPEEAVRVARAALEFLQDEEWPGERSLEGQARMLVARAQQQLGNLDEAVAEAEAAASSFEREGGALQALLAMRFAAESAWQGRRAEETQRWVERGIHAARKLDAPDQLTKLLSLAATLANLRGEYQRAHAYVAEIERLAPGQKASEMDAVPSGGRLVVALANPVTAREPATAVTTEEYEVLANVLETLVARDKQGDIAPCLAESWTLGEGRSLRLSLRHGVRFSDGAPLTAGAVKLHLERAIRQRREELPAVFAAIAGVREYASGAASEVAGLAAVGEDALVIELKEPLPIFPALLTDMTAAIGRVVSTPGGGESLIGTGPFQIASWSKDRIVLERNPHHWREGLPRLEAIEFQPAMSAAAIASGLREGKLDLARDLLPADLEELQRAPHFRGGLVETPKRGTYFVLFNSSGPTAKEVAIRRALAGVVRSQDFVWSTLGRFAVPATGLIPPGILGHDPGRRRPHLTPEKAAELIKSSGLEPPLRLRASVHPVYNDRYRALTSALFGIWKEMGIEIEVVASTMSEYLETWHRSEGIDLVLFRWIADYDDPDNFTFSLFHSENGLLKSHLSSSETDRVLAEARTENRPAARESLYRKFEDVLLEGGHVVPLFHEVDYRLASPAVKGLELRSSPPFVNYAEAGKVVTQPSELATTPGGGTVEVPMAGTTRTLDPSLTETVEEAEFFPAIFDGLAKCVEGRVVPWLAAEIRAESNQTRFRIRLRPGVRFHDGRPLTARDVRFSFERLLQNRGSSYREMFRSVQGAMKLIGGETTELSGFRMLSPHEFVLELERPISFFPVLLAHPATSILPEGTSELGTSWRQGCVGAGPFRVVGFEPGRRLELERNPHYWRDGFPQSEGLVFRFGVPPGEIKNDFLGGRLSLASDMLPADVEELRHDPRYASGYRECPSLSTYFVAFNIHSEKLTEVRLRRALIEALDVPALLRQSMGRLAVPANGFIPPGLLGHSTTAPARPKRMVTESSGFTRSQQPVELTAVVNPVFFGEYAALLGEITRVFREMGFTVRPVNSKGQDFMPFVRAVSTDLYIGRWVADYPDADTFVYNLIPRGYPGVYCGTPEIGRLAEQARAESDPRARHSLYRQVEEILVRDALLLPLFHEQVYRFARPEVEGLSLGFASPTVAYEELRIRR